MQYVCTSNKQLEIYGHVNTVRILIKTFLFILLSEANKIAKIAVFPCRCCLAYCKYEGHFCLFTAPIYTTRHSQGVYPCYKRIYCSRLYTMVLTLMTMNFYVTYLSCTYLYLARKKI